MVKCGICLEEYQEGDLELHRQMCEVRLVFRCSLCNSDYVNKEGLWNHLDLHEIADEIKEQHYQEIKAKHKLHQCVLCNDQRAYSEISYWNHVHGVHDGFFLSSPDCGENFRSEKLKNDHASSRCKARDPLEEEQVPIEVGNRTADGERFIQLWGDQSSSTNEGPDNRLSIDYADKNSIDTESELPTIKLPSRFPCDLCGKSFSSKKTRTGHKAAKYTCLERRQRNLSSRSSSSTKCFHCNKECISARSLRQHIRHSHQPTKCETCGITFEGYSQARYHELKYHHGHKEPEYECRTCGRKFPCKLKYNTHCIGCEHKMYSCKLCGSTFKQLYSVKQHLKQYHPNENNLQNIQIVQDQKQVQNIDLKMEITVEETTISARVDQGVSSINPSSDVSVIKKPCLIPFIPAKANGVNGIRHGFSMTEIREVYGTYDGIGSFIDSRSNEQSSAYLNEDDIMDSQVIHKESQTVSVAPMNCSSKRRVVTVETSQPLDENLSTHPYFCNICGITMHTYSRFHYHKATKHKEGRHQCPHCSRKFHFKQTLGEHVSCCTRLRHSCELCGQKFSFQSRVEDHKKRVHHGSRSLRDANIEGADCTEEQKQDTVEKMDAAEEMISCVVCRISFASTELMKHQLNCPKHSKEHDDSQLSSENISLLHGVSEAQDDSTIVPLGDNIEIKLEIEVEETMLQEQEFQVPNGNPEKSSATTLHPDGDKSKDDESEDADDLENEIKVKLECIEDEEETIAEHQTRKISNQKAGADVIRPVPVKSCSFEEAKLFAKNFEFGFSLQTQKILKKGCMQYYRCSRLKLKARPQCERKLFICTPNKNEKSTVCAKGEHSCMNAPPENLTGAAQIGFVYAPVKTCSMEDAKSFVKNFEFGFCYRSDQIGKNGRTHYYFCSRIKKGAWPQCERRVLICTPDTNEESTVYAKGEHSCMNAPPGNLTLSQLGSGYALVKTCSLEDAKSFVENFEFGYAFHEENGNIRYYRCSRIKQQTGPQCKRKVLIFTPDTNEESMVCAKWEHSCTNAPPKNMTVQAQIDSGYAPVKTCSMKDAKSFVKNLEFGFSFQSEIISTKGSMRYYRCSRFKRSARPQCERKVLICTPDTNGESTVCAKGEHSCINASPENLI